MKLIESVAVDQVADLIVALMWTRQVGFSVQDGAQAMIAAVRRQLKDGETLILMQGDISNAYGSINRLLVLKTEKRFEPSFAALCAPQFVRI